MSLRPLAVLVLLCNLSSVCCASKNELKTFKKSQKIGRLSVSHLYSDRQGRIVGSKLQDASGAPIYLFQIETVPQAFMWIDTPATSDRGLAHSLEHLLAGRGTKGRYLKLLRGMRLSQSKAATTDDYNFYSFSSGTGLGGFWDQFHAWLDALYHPDFSDLEAEREFFHFGVSFDESTQARKLIEEGPVYNEMRTNQGAFDYYFRLNGLVLGESSPFAFNISGSAQDMHHVLPADIRTFYQRHYKIGATTGFVFVLDPKENVRAFLERISSELAAVAGDPALRHFESEDERPKYPIDPASPTKIEILPFPSNNRHESGEVRFGWKSVKVHSRVDLKLLQMFFKALGDGDKSVLHRALIDSRTRKSDFGATNVESTVFTLNSPYYPAEFIGLSGIPGTQITSERISELRSAILNAVREIANYSDHSPELDVFNRLVYTYARSSKRAELVWSKSAPRFGGDASTEWKERLEELETNPLFVRSLTDEANWKQAYRQIASGHNIWRDLIKKFGLLVTPYCTASRPSPEAEASASATQQALVNEELAQLIKRFNVTDEQSALRQFEENEALKTEEIDKIALLVKSPHFPEHPPLALDDDIRYRQVRIKEVPAIVSEFASPPVVDLGLSFDLRKIPQKYYKYLPFLPSWLNSQHSNSSNGANSSPELHDQLQSQLNEFTIQYESNPVSGRMDLRLHASAISITELQNALPSLKAIMTANGTGPVDLDHLRDRVEELRWEEEGFDKGDNDFWFINPAYAVRYQQNALYLALASSYTRSHWISRMSWMLHKSVAPTQVKELVVTAQSFLTKASGMTVQQISDALNQARSRGLQRELYEYWGKNINSFPENQVIEGLNLLLKEVEHDLAVTPAKFISQMRELQRIVFQRDALHVDLVVSPTQLRIILPRLSALVQSLPKFVSGLGPVTSTSSDSLITNSALKHFKNQNSNIPVYVGFVDSRNSTANLMFFGKTAGYSDTDQDSLTHILAANVLTGVGPSSVYTKAAEAGLAYGSSLSSNLKLQLLIFYAAKTPDASSLLTLVNSVVAKSPEIDSSERVDYALQGVFPIPRTMGTSTERGKGIAEDIRDGNNPTKIREFSQALLKLRSDSGLSSELRSLVPTSVCSVSIRQDCRGHQDPLNSLFLIFGPDKQLVDLENRFGIRIMRLYPSDFWLDFDMQRN